MKITNYNLVRDIALGISQKIIYPKCRVGEAQPNPPNPDEWWVPLRFTHPTPQLKWVVYLLGIPLLNVAEHFSTLIKFRV